MKHIRHISLTAILLAGSVINVQAAEIEFTSPDINNELNLLVEEKINELTRETGEHGREAGFVEYAPGAWSSVPAVTHGITNPEQSSIRSEVL